MYDVAICEDQLTFLGFLRELVEEWASDKSMNFKIYTYKTGEELLAERISFDIIFLDICLDGGADGIAIGKKIRQQNKRVKIIYITGSDSYQEAAQDVHYFSYIKKPVSKEKVREHIADAVEYLEEGSTILFFTTNEGILHFRVKDIYYMNFQDGEVYLHTKYKNYIVNETLQSLAERMEPYRFERAHRAFLVNLYCVNAVFAKEVTLSNDEIIPLAPKRSHAFRQKFFNLLFN